MVVRHKRGEGEEMQKVLLYKMIQILSAARKLTKPSSLFSVAQEATSPVKIGSTQFFNGLFWRTLCGHTQPVVRKISGWMLLLLHVTSHLLIYMSLRDWMIKELRSGM